MKDKLTELMVKDHLFGPLVRDLELVGIDRVVYAEIHKQLESIFEYYAVQFYWSKIESDEAQSLMNALGVRNQI